MRGLFFSVDYEYSGLIVTKVLKITAVVIHVAFVVD